MTEAIRIAMLSGPRNISTTMMRAFENRPDVVVHDEPFYACYLAATGADHPMREAVLVSQPTDWAAVSGNLDADDRAAISFEKHIAFHFIDGAPLDWLAGRRVFMLIRDPRAMVASYRNKYDDVSPIVHSYAVQRRVFEAFGPCPVVDAADILKKPEAMLRALCDSLGIVFSDAMLSWPAGPRASDGVWAPHWYDAVIASTGFRPYAEKSLDLPPALADIAAACAADYAFFHSRRLVV